ncbi:MAG: aminotransferase class V-fold PLP-dependent enzyme, partial [Bacillota bacterium]
MRKSKALLFEMSRPERQGYSLPSCDVPEKPVDELLPKKMQRSEPLDLPELSENEIIRHYTELSTRNFGVDTGFYPLGSCTMKYNPKVNEDVATLPGFALMHPCQPMETTQGALELLYNMEQGLKELTAMDRFTLQPAAGAHGELTGLMVIQAYHRHREDYKRNKVLIPLSAHGTNPATVSMAGYEVVQVPCDDRGLVDLEALKEAVDDTTAALMLTNPSTLGLFEEEIVAMAKAVHEAGGLLYYDGANLNAIMGYARPGDM